jgi:hypothetical protein
MHQTLRTLLDGLIDYAGLFPPAGLALEPALECYARESMGEHAAALGRFICPVSRLADLSKAAGPLMPGTFATSGYREMTQGRPAWRISVIIDQPLDLAIDAIDHFNDHHARAEHGLAEVDALEMKIDQPDDIDTALDIIPDDILPFFEFQSMDDPRGFIAALAGADAAAKIRCGGITPDAIPPAPRVAAFLAACAAAEVPFKATAGLHHPIRAEQNLTYDPQPPRAIMHGFINVFLAAALLHARAIDPDQAVATIEEIDPAAFRFTPDRAQWRDASVTLDELADACGSFALGFGSCSFTEPIADLRALGWL